MTKHSSTKPPLSGAAGAPDVVLGDLVVGTVAPGILAMVERGVRLRPELAAQPGAIRLRSREGWPSVLVELGDPVRVSDDEQRRVDVEITASLPDLLALLRAPLTAGLPNPARREGRAALGALRRGDVEIVGLRSVALKLLRLLSLR